MFSFLIITWFSLLLFTGFSPRNVDILQKFSRNKLNISICIHTQPWIETWHNIHVNQVYIFSLFCTQFWHEWSLLMTTKDGTSLHYMTFCGWKDRCNETELIGQCIPYSTSYPWDWCELNQLSKSSVSYI